MKKIAVLILTYNEEKNIEECIRSASFADEVVVIDSGSNDRTKNLAESLGAKVYIQVLQSFAAQRNFALEKTDAEWVFYLDADERLTEAAAKEIRQLVESEVQAAYEIKRMNIVFGQMMRYGGHGPDYSLRLYPRKAVHWEGVVHENVVIALPTYQMQAVMHHYTYTDWDRYFFKFNQYTTLTAKKLKENGKMASRTDIVLHPIFGFLKFYILKQGFREGFLGFVMAVMHMFYTMVKYLKLRYL
jgi:glycosyltransferase involved in cell wall biosynthesis